MYRNPYITGISQSNASYESDEYDKSKSLSDSEDYSSSESSISSRKKISKKTQKTQQNQFLPNPNAQFSRSDLRNSNRIKRKQLQNLIKSAILVSLEKVTPDQTDKISEKLAYAIEKKAQQTAEDLFINTTDYDQIKIQNMNQMIQMQYDQYMQNGYLREMQYNMMMQTSAGLMKQDDNDQENEEEEEEAESENSEDSENSESN